MNAQTKQKTIKAALSNVLALKSISVKNTSNLERNLELNGCGGDSSCAGCA